MDAPPGEKPELVKTYLGNMIIVPEMIGSIVGVYNSKTFNQVNIKSEMIDMNLLKYYPFGAHLVYFCGSVLRYNFSSQFYLFVDLRMLVLRVIVIDAGG